jgi:hypothetical protein
MLGWVLAFCDEALNGKTRVRKMGAVFGNLEGGICNSFVEGVGISLKQGMSG